MKIKHSIQVTFLLPIALLAYASNGLVEASVLNKETYQDENGNAYIVRPSPLGGGLIVQDENGNDTFIKQGLSPAGTYHDENLNTYTTGQTIAGNKIINFDSSGTYSQRASKDRKTGLKTGLSPNSPKRV